ncbi:DinB family protein [Cryptosporangium phraense]|uniref:DinB family protein n=1 Tax=Cryptosporangium phraense TaxID=2593070 RepID=A0A545AP30_9ACTN|nr:DinB family protein [Cryptosporangium phraense]TQS42505.1 DinB family protein [Cryptosporangium phraense]
MEWNRVLREQWEYLWNQQVRARLHGLTDDEYFWSPAPNPWTVRPHRDGSFAMDFTYPPPEPAPFTTIAWRLNHVIFGVLAMRNTWHFGAPATSWETWEFAGRAATALQQLDEQVDVWLAGVRSLGEDGLAAPVGDKEPYPDSPMATLILHVQRELIHHLSEVSLLRDLYLHTNGARP